MTAVIQCELTPGPDAVYAAASWVQTHLTDLAAEVLVVALATAVLTTRPSRILLTITQPWQHMRITVYGSGPVGEDALTPVGQQIVQHFATDYGVGPDGAGLWAEIGE